jgi:hypothetical protein
MQRRTLMDPVILHAGGSPCRHHGPPGLNEAGGGWLCAAGIPVTHVRVGDRVMTLDEAIAAFAVAVGEALRPLIDATAEFAGRLAAALGSRVAIEESDD